MLFFLLLLLIAACALPNTPAPSAIPQTPRDSAAPPTTSAPVGTGDFDAQRAFAYAQMLAVIIGKRAAGSDGGARAGDYLAQQLQSYGYQVERQAFPFEAWEDRGTQVALAGDAWRPLDAQPIQYSPAGDVDSAVVAVAGIGTPEDFTRVDVRGKIALVQRGTLPFSDKANNAANAGARAVLIYNNAPGLYGGTLRNRIALPVIALSGAEGAQLTTMLTQGAVRVHLVSDTRIAHQTGYNIIATRRGTSAGTLVLGGHYDSVVAGPGANDNGSGTAVILELARVLAPREHKLTLIIIGFDAEEFGLIGSRYYVDHLSATERGHIRAMVNFDMLGGGSGPLLLGGDGNVAQLAHASAQALGIAAQSFHPGNNTGSDHISFTRVGIDTVCFSRDYSLLHTPQDTIDHVKPEYLGEAGRVAVQLIERLETQPAL
jgi:aminopeptidase YwaD